MDNTNLSMENNLNLSSHQSPMILGKVL